MELIDKEVDFEEFCPKCKYWELNDGEDPCNECLANPRGQSSRVPQEFKMGTDDEIKETVRKRRTLG